MLNRSPIFVNGFQRGGTNILVNLIASHPEVALLRTETHEVFYGRNSEHFRKWLARLSSIPVLLAGGKEYFWPYYQSERKRLPKILMSYIDGLFYVNKIAASENRRGNSMSYPSPAGKRSVGEVGRARLLAKNVNGVVLTTDLLAEMYPDVTFIALMRDGFALCEGFIRRGWSVERFGEMYERIGQKMIHDAQRRANYHLVRFEDLILDPRTTLEKVYAAAGLDLSQVKMFRLQAKLSMDQDGNRQYTFGVENRQLRWFPAAELGTQFRRDVNDNQRARLTPSQKEKLTTLAQGTLSHFGYLS
jgi:hypothetical protein